MKRLNLDEFVEFVEQVNPAISRPHADLFMDNYYSSECDWVEFKFFPDIMRERTNLPFAVILDLDSAYQLYLASCDIIQRSEAVECAEFNRFCKLSLQKVGADNFVSRLHCCPKFIFEAIADEQTVKDALTLAVEADNIGNYPIRVEDDQ